MPATSEQSEQTSAATHRLQRIIVQEVSLVDRAANKRRFLVVKRDETMAKATETKKEDAAAATANVADENTAGAGSGASADAGSGASGGMQQQVKEALTVALADAAEKIVAIANEVDKLEVTDQPADPPVPATVLSQIQDCAKALTEIATKFGAKTEGGEGVTAGEQGGEAPAPNPTGEGAAQKAKDEEGEPTDAEKAAVKESEEEVEKKGLVLAKSRDLVTKSVAKRLSINLEAAQVVVAKVGRRMAKKRLEQLGKAIDMLIGLMKELRYEDQKRAAKTATQKSDTTPAAPAATATASGDVEKLLKSTDALLEAAKVQAVELTKVRTDLVAAHATIARLEKQTAGSNALPIEKSGGSEAGGSVAWPMDMNARAPGTRPSAAK